MATPKGPTPETQSKIDAAKRLIAKGTMSKTAAMKEAGIDPSQFYKYNRPKQNKPFKRKKRKAHSEPIGLMVPEHETQKPGKLTVIVGDRNEVLALLRDMS